MKSGPDLTGVVCDLNSEACNTSYVRSEMLHIFNVL